MKRILLFLAVLVYGVVYGQVPANFQVNSNAVWFKDDGGVGTFKPGGWVIVDNGIILNGDTMTSVPSGGGGGGGLVSLTYAQLQTLILGGTINPGSLYKITDRGDMGLYFMGLSNTTLDFKNGARDMLVPLTYQTGNFNGFDWLGIWNSGLTPSAGNLAIWGGHVWENVSGNVGAPVDQFTLDTAWTLMPKSIGAYKVKTLGCNYDFENDWIAYCWDENGNKLGIDYLFGVNALSLTQSATNYCDWVVDLVAGVASINNECYYLCNNIAIVYNNKIQGAIYNNTSNGSIYGNSNAGDISSNSNNGGIYYNSNLGQIANNTNLGYIFNNSNNGSIDNNSNNGDIFDNSNNGSINSNSNGGQIQNNKNNGYIQSLTSITQNVLMNINNGNITVDFAGDITDSVVNK